VPLTHTDCGPYIAGIVDALKMDNSRGPERKVDQLGYKAESKLVTDQYELHPRISCAGSAHIDEVVRLWPSSG
jgi:hypothetical protein